MSLVVFLAVVVASLFQAWWNFYLKKVDVDRTIFLAIGWLLFGLVATPLSFIVEGVPNSMDWWPYLATGFVHGLYLLVLSWAYNVGDISYVFPMARGLSVVITTLMIASLGFFQPSTVGLVGIGAVILGALILGSSDLKKNFKEKSLVWVILLAMIVATYTVIDSTASKSVPLLLYLSLMNLIAPLVVLPFLFKRKKAEIILVLQQYKWRGFLVGFAGTFGYLIVVWAYRWAPAPYVAALREISIVMAIALGVFSLKEKLVLRKAIGIVFILMGIIIIKAI